MPTMKSGCHASVDMIEESQGTRFVLIVHVSYRVQIICCDTPTETPLHQEYLSIWGGLDYLKAELGPGTRL